MIYYVLFETAEDGYYGDFVIDNKLYTEDEVKTYIQTHAQKTFEEDKYYFKAVSINEYGTGFFYFKEFITQNKQPTLKECIKEWEELGYKCICDNEDLLEFEHVFLPMNIEFNKEQMWYGSTSNDITQLSIQEHLLITKTFKALGWFNE